VLCARVPYHGWHSDRVREPRVHARRTARLAIPPVRVRVPQSRVGARANIQRDRARTRRFTAFS